MTSTLERHKHRQNKHSIIPTGNAYIETNNILLNSDKTTCALLMADPAEYSTPKKQHHTSHKR